MRQLDTLMDSKEGDLKEVKILVVDDEPVVLRSLERVLGEQGHSVHSAPDAREAITLIEQNIYNLVFTDLKMPGMDGITLIRHLRQILPDAGIVVITGYPTQQTIQDALQMGCIDYIPKPFTPVMLTDVTARALERIKKRLPPGELPTERGDVKRYFYIRGGDVLNAGSVSSLLKSHLTQLGLPADIVRRASVVAFEAEMNVVIHALAGALIYVLKENELKILLRDVGPGIEDVEMAMREGYTTAPHWSKQLGWGSGLGLPNIKKNADSFTISSVAGEGTTLEIGIRLDSGLRPDDNR